MLMSAVKPGRIRICSACMHVSMGGTCGIPVMTCDSSAGEAATGAHQAGPDAGRPGCSGPVAGGPSQPAAPLGR